MNGQKLETLDGSKIEVTNIDYSATHFEARLLTGRYKGRVQLFIKSRPYKAA